MNDVRTIQELADAAVAKYIEAAQRAAAPIPPTPQEQLEARLREARFRELATREALMHDVRPQAIRHVVRDAEDVFTVKDDTLVPRYDQTDPADPLSPLTPARWLVELAKTDGYLFVRPARAH
jgi:hypothetical protein